ncbi:MAG: glycosyltransferase family 4 protein [bacterium]|nr:glycosyltransferase family 4 protein [bacterium]
MKVLILYDFPLWGNGSATWIRHTVEELVRMNYKIGIVVPEQRRFLEDKIKQYNAAIPQVPVFVGNPELPGAKRYSELSDREITDIYKGFLDTTIEAVHNFEPDIIHAHHMSLISWVARYINALRGTKYIITSHGSDLIDIRKDKRFFSLTEGAVRYAKAITVNSGYTKSHFYKLFGRGYSKVTHLIPGGVDVSAFPAQKNLEGFDETYGMKDKRVVLFTGRLISHKGVRYLVKAAKDIRGEVFVVGDGPERPYLESLVRKIGLSNVHLVGYKTESELLDFYYRASVFVAPSVWDEPLGLTILEAMASRTPVVATRKGGIPTLVKHGQNGLLIPARNAGRIAQACNKLLEDEELRKRLGEQARKTVEEKFTWKIIAEKTDHLYRQVLRNGKNGKK